MPQKQTYNWSTHQKLVNHIFTQIIFIECLLGTENASTTCLSLNELIYQFKELGDILERCFKMVHSNFKYIL